ncbi:MAG: DUF4292 domain-containing protein [bacterium]|nr:DUF4292 domain-containing protein [bacterium]
MKRITASVIALIIVILITGCAHISKRAPLSLDRISIAQIRHNLEQNNLRYRSMLADAEISIESPTINFTAASKIALKKNDSLFIQIKAPFGIGVATIFVDKTKFLVYNSFENSLYFGDPQKINSKQFFPIDIKFENIFQVFSGIHLLDDSENDSLALDNNQYLIVVKDRDNIQKYWIDPQKFVVTEFQLTGLKSEKLATVEYKQFEKTEKMFLPKLIQITQPGRKTRLTILYSDRKINYPLEEKDFKFKVPSQVKKIQL